MLEITYGWALKRGRKKLLKSEIQRGTNIIANESKRTGKLCKVLLKYSEKVASKDYKTC